MGLLHPPLLPSPLHGPRAAVPKIITARCCQLWSQEGDAGGSSLPWDPQAKQCPVLMEHGQG